MRGRRKTEGPSGPGLYRIGCLGRIVSFSETDDGRYLITLSGLLRFAVAEELPMRRGYRRVRADVSAFGADLAAGQESEAGLHWCIMADLLEIEAERKDQSVERKTQEQTD